MGREGEKRFNGSVDLAQALNSSGRTLSRDVASPGERPCRILPAKTMNGRRTTRLLVFLPVLPLAAFDGCCFRALPELDGGLPRGSAGASGGGTSGGLDAGGDGGAVSGGTTGASSDGGRDGGADGCALTLAPSTLSFRGLAVGVPVTKQLSLSNSGAGSCSLSQLSISQGVEAAFSFPSTQESSFSLGPGATGAISVSCDLTRATPPGVTGSLHFEAQGAPETVSLVAWLSGGTDQPPIWGEWRMDALKDSQSPADTSKLAGQAVALAALAPAPGAGSSASYLSSPVVDGQGDVLQISIDGSLRAYQPGTGLIWQQPIAVAPGAPPELTPAILVDETIVVATGHDGVGPNLYHFSGDGQLLYAAAATDAGFVSSPARLWDLVTVLEATPTGGADGGGALEALAFAEGPQGTLVQEASASLPLAELPSRAAVAVDSSDTSYWTTEGRAFALGAPDAGGFGPSGWPSGGVVVADPTGDPDRLSEIASTASLSLDERTLYVASAWEDQDPVSLRDSVVGLLVALAAADGQLEWSVPLPRTELPAGWNRLASDFGNGGPAVAQDGTVYVGSGDGLWAIDGSSGMVEWLHPSADVSSAPAIGGDGTLFYGTSAGTLEAVSHDGGSRFSLALNHPISSSPAITMEGQLVFVSDDGTLYSVR